MLFTHPRRGALPLLAVAGLVLAGCGGVKTSDSGSSAVKEIVIGASIPISGPLAGFGSFEKFGYQQAVREANASGGIKIDGKKLKVKLKLLDDKTDPNTVSSNIDSLVSGDKVNALLGSCTPALVIPGAIAAERAKVPFVTACAPVTAFGAAKKWAWAWDIFFDETKLPSVLFSNIEAAGATTNKKVALLHDNGPDGVALGQQMPGAAKAAGYDLVVNESFPTDATDLSAAVRKAKNSGADVLLVDAVTPQAVSIRKQMKTASYSPKVVDMEKGAEPQQFADALGNLADGVSVAAYWDPSFSYKGAAALADEFKKQVGSGVSQHIADTYTAAKVLLDAMGRAGSLDPKAINTAISKTDAEYPVGPVKFRDDHTSPLELTAAQWQGGQVKIVWPSDKANAKFLFPVPNAS